jgi:hypothetical protein
LAVTTTWVLAYLAPADRARFGQALADVSRDRDVVWISAEAPGVVPGLEAEPQPVDTSSVLAARRFAGGREGATTVLGRCHPHGAALAWTAGRGSLDR